MPRDHNRHSHPCINATCRNRVICEAPLERNEDGFPPVVCLSYHVDGDRPECDDCQASACKGCGARLRLEPHEPDCPKRPAPAAAVATVEPEPVHA